MSRRTVRVFRFKETLDFSFAFVILALNL